MSCTKDMHRCWFEDGGGVSPTTSEARHTTSHARPRTGTHTHIHTQTTQLNAPDKRQRRGSGKARDRGTTGTTLRVVGHGLDKQKQKRARGKEDTQVRNRPPCNTTHISALSGETHKTWFQPGRRLFRSGECESEQERCITFTSATRPAAERLPATQHAVVAPW